MNQASGKDELQTRKNVTKKKKYKLIEIKYNQGSSIKSRINIKKLIEIKYIRN